MPLIDKTEHIAHDLEIIKRISSGNEVAFKDMYEDTHHKVYFYLLSQLNDKVMAEDVLVETYAEVWRCANKFKGNSRLLTWIIGIARNLAMNNLRKEKYHNNIEAHVHLTTNDDRFTWEFMDRKRVLGEALLRLSPRHREVLELVFYHEMTCKEVSNLLSIPENTVKTRVFYAKNALKKVLKGLGVGKDDL